MSIKPLKRTDSNGNEYFDGVFAFVNGYPLVLANGKRDPKGKPSPTLERIKQNFPESKGYKLKDAEKWVAAQITLRDRIEIDRRFGHAEIAMAEDRTIEELAEYYFQHEDFTSCEPSSQASYRAIIEEFLEWNRFYGRPRASLWSEDLAKRRINALRDGYKDKNGDWHKPHEPSGVEKNVIMNRKLFLLELKRKPSAISEDPWPVLKIKKSDESQLDPRPYSRAEIAALFECMEPYEKLVFTALYNIGARSEELLKLRIDRIELDSGGDPVRIVLRKTKNHKPRKIPLNRDAANAFTGLLRHTDESGFVIRRDFVHYQKGGTKITTPLLRALNRVKKRAVTKYPHLNQAFFGRVDVIIEGKRKPRCITNVHTFRKTFVTELLLAGVNVVTVAQLIGDDVSTLIKHYAGILSQDHAIAVHKLPGIGNQPQLETQNFGSPETLTWKSGVNGHPDGHPVEVT